MIETNETAFLTVDVVALAETGGQRFVLLIERAHPPHTGQWALPGGHLDRGEDFQDAARRELAEETGLRTAELEQVGFYGAPGRDPRGRYVSVAYLARLDYLPAPTAGDDAAAARWLPVTQVLNRPEQLAFDHAAMLTDALALIDRPATYTANTTVSGNAQVGEVVGFRFGQ